jgi:alcohol-forming fatty acyl-CoA reductase
VTSHAAFKILNFLCHTFPAALLDFKALLFNQKRIYLRSFKKLEKVLMMMSYFGKKQWTFKNGNVHRLRSETKNFVYQKGSLDVDVALVNWSEYFKHFLPGIKRFVFKETLDGKSKLRYQILKQTHRLVKFTFAMLFALKSFNVVKFMIKIIILMFKKVG